MSKINLISTINNDEFTEYVYEKYDIQNKELVLTEIPNINFEEVKDFNILLILGNSGSGKSTILRGLGGSNTNFNYDYSKSLVSQFPNKTPEEVCEIFYGIGLSSVPTWLKKPNELSNGEKARFEIAYQIANAKDGETIFIDEFTSVVNRPCAQSMSFSLQRYVRNHNLKVVIASCHYDVVEFLQPDYVFDLNQQEKGECEIQKFVYSDDKDYKAYKLIADKDILSDATKID